MLNAPQLYDQLQVLSCTFLDKSKCQTLIENHNNNLEAIMQSRNNVEDRNVFIKDININEVYNLKEMLINANKHHYKFDLDFDKIDCFFSRYEENQHYQTLHLDCIPGNIQRKLTFSLLLNDDYTGGNLEMLENHISKEMGKLVVFPSFLPHKVSQISKGVRFSIFGWVYGPHFI